MSDTTFEIDCLPKYSQELFYRVLRQDEVNHYLAEIRQNDIQTYAHSLKVARMVAKFATSGVIDLNLEQAEATVRAAALHDLGKITVHNSILYKPGELDNDEWASVKKHPISGFLRCAADFDPHSVIPILKHHSFQSMDYPSIEEQADAIFGFDISKRELDDEDVINSTIMISVADHLDARNPAQDEGIRSYSRQSKQRYSVKELPSIVKSDFKRAGKIEAIGKGRLLDDLLAIAN